MDPSEDKLNKLGVIPVFLKISLAFNKHLITGLFRGKDAPSTYRRDVSYGVVREVVSGFSTLQGQWLTPGTDKVYRQIAISRNQKPNTITLEANAKGHWIGNPNAKYVMIYFHGGGFISAATTGHMKYQFQLQKAMKKLGHSFSMFSLSYTLAPQALYPVQLQQAASALKYLLEYDKRSPSTILLGGDSAGGNLASALLLHLAHPQPQVPAIQLSAPLHAALVISPWISFDTSTASIWKNCRSDYLTPRALERASKAYVGRNGKHDVYSEPRLAPADWWCDVAKVVKDVMVWGGGGEMLIDGIRTFAHAMIDGFTEADSAGGADEQAGGETDPEKPGDGEQFWSAMSLPTPRLELVQRTEKIAEKKEKNTKGRVKYVETPRQAHEEMIMNKILRIRGKGEGAKEIEEWLGARL